MNRLRKKPAKFNAAAGGFRQRPKWLKRLSLAIPVVMFVSGIYLLSLVMAPKLVPLLNSGDVAKDLESSLPQEGNDRLYIQKLGINVPFKAGGAEVMKDGGAWHRFAERGDPAKGGNFILSAHRWRTGRTPAETIAQSPFYNADRLAVGDSIFVDFEGKRYKYEIYELAQVKPDQTEIEAPLKEDQQPHMTLYTCTLKGAADGRVVVYAKLAEVV